MFGQLLGWEIVPAEQGDAGLRLALEHSPELIILDLQLPDRDGIDVLRELRGQAGVRHTPIIVVCDGMTEQLRQSVLDAGAHSCFTKPIQVRSLMDAIACLI